MKEAEIIAYLTNQATPAQQKGVEVWLAANPKNEITFRRIKLLWEASRDETVPMAPDVERAWKNIHAHTQKPTRVLRQKWWYGSIAACFMLLIGLCTWIWWPKVDMQEMVQGDYVATLPILLADGTKVWLNQNSTLHYPKIFNGSKRKVVLSGQAFFEVARDESHAFLIETPSTTVKVLGTSFDVMAYPDSLQHWVQVQFGKVAFFANNNADKQLLLTKGQMGLYDRQKDQLLFLDNRPNDLAWQNGVIEFKHNNVTEICRVLEKHFKVKFKLNNPNLADCRLTGRFEHVTLDYILETMKFTLDIKITRTTNLITLDGMGCS
ncbi:MAG: anti-sigma factor [Saprospiraceae bacterium]|nr:MAG: anti-sigma factor [Saprospiraceae bacterium]